MYSLRNIALSIYYSPNNRCVYIRDQITFSPNQHIFFYPSFQIPSWIKPLLYTWLWSRHSTSFIVSYTTPWEPSLILATALCKWLPPLFASLSHVINPCSSSSAGLSWLSRWIYFPAPEILHLMLLCHPHDTHYMPYLQIYLFFFKTVSYYETHTGLKFISFGLSISSAGVISMYH
jgi:hypothetical protein